MAKVTFKEDNFIMMESFRMELLMEKENTLVSNIKIKSVIMKQSLIKDMLMEKVKRPV